MVKQLHLLKQEKFLPLIQIALSLCPLCPLW